MRFPVSAVRPYCLQVRLQLLNKSQAGSTAVPKGPLTTIFNIYHNEGAPALFKVPFQYPPPSTGTAEWAEAAVQGKPALLRTQTQSQTVVEMCG